MAALLSIDFIHTLVMRLSEGGHVAPIDFL